MNLFKNTVQPGTWDLLTGLMTLPALEAFALVGGTNLSLKLGHRMSVDIDLFTNAAFDRIKVYESIREKYPGVVKLGEREQTLWLTINGVKSDFILHQYPYLQAVEAIEGVRFLSYQDIIPMKLEAMATRGVKKDFWDLAYLLNHFSLEQMLDYYAKKYTQSDVGHIILSLTYFEDAEKQRLNPRDLNGLTWNDVKEKIRKAVSEFIRSRN